MALTEKLTAIADAIRIQSGKSDKLTLDQMPDEIIDLQSLNFEVAGNPQPENPKENTVWIDTDTEITSWAFSATAPEAAEGMVWVQTGTTSSAEFNALKKNNLKVYPVSVKQYVGGAWVTREAKTYQNGAWVDWAIWLYNRGNTYDAITGGWVTHNNTTLGSDGIIMAMNGGTAIQNIARPNNAIDFTDINTVKIVFDKFTASDTDVWIRCVISRNPFTDLNNTGTYYLWHDLKPESTPNNMSGTIALDTSALTGDGYLHIVEHNLAGNMTSYIRILEVKGE